MVGEKLVAIRDDLGRSTTVAGVIGLVSGGTIAFASIVVNGSPDEGLLAPLYSNALALSVVIAVSVVLGAALGVCVGVVEGAIAFVFAHRSAKTFRHLPTFAAVLSLCFVFVNATIAALVTGWTYGLTGTRIEDFFAPAMSAICTAMAIAAFARLQASDWPQWRERTHVKPAHYSDVLDLNAEESTADQRLLAMSQRQGERRERDAGLTDEPTIGLPQARRREE